MIKFTTESGSTYVIPQDESNTIVRYPSDEAAQLRKDGDAVTIKAINNLYVGYSAELLISLDSVTDPNYAGTVRVTTPVTEILVIDNETGKTYSVTETGEGVLV